MNRQIVLVFFTLLATVVLFEYSHLDLAVQDYFYNFELSQWIINRDNALLKLFLYDGIKKLFIIFVLALSVALILFRETSIMRRYRRGFIIVLLSSITVPLSVGVLKAVTHIPCPKNIQQYGGSYPHITLFKHYPQNFQQSQNIQCYPAGHASGGFALMSLFFLFKKRKHRIIALVSSITTGWVTGGYKMLIGDHFLSHTLVTMLLAWLIILIITRMICFKQSTWQEVLTTLASDSRTETAKNYS